MKVNKILPKLPAAPGIYLMKDSRGRILYIGKAGNLQRRVASYFERPQEARFQNLLQKTAKIDYRKTDTALEALILESRLIKKHQPAYNIREKDDKSFLWVEITDERWPRVLLVRGRETRRSGGRGGPALFGPFTAASQIRAALRIIRRIFPYSLHTPPKPVQSISHKSSDRFFSERLTTKRPCLDYQLGLCPGTCIGRINPKQYSKNIKNIKLFFAGKKERIIKNLHQEMRAAAKKLDYETAEKIKRQIFALRHIQDTAFLNEPKFTSSQDVNLNLRIEGYDVSNISGTAATGAMVVFENEEPAPDQYRRFRIRSFTAPNDIGMIKEMLRRRFRHQEWPLPDLVLIDGGRAQTNAAQKILEESGLKIPVVGIAKGADRKKNEFINIDDFANPMDLRSPNIKNTLIKVRDEAHRFALSYHRKLRHKFSTGPALA